VESTIHELSNIFTQLATMVSQQGELAIRWTFRYWSFVQLKSYSYLPKYYLQLQAVGPDENLEYYILRHFLKNSDEC
jgi:hypothetical protein